MANKRKQRTRKITLQDVADAAKVSKATASLALQKNSRISEATRQRVLEAVDALGYVYNQRAASLRTRRSFTIGLIVSSLANPFYPEMIRGAEAHLAGNDYRMLLGNSADDLGRQSRALTAMLESDVDGLILAPAAGTTAETLQTLVRHCSLVLLTRYVPDLDCDYLGMDNVAGSRRAMEFLIEQGHRRIAFIGGPVDSSARRDRLLGYSSVLERYDIDFDSGLCIPSPVSRRGGFDAVESMMELPNPPTAALCYNDVVAFGVMLGLRAAGIEPGAKFGVIGFDDVAEASMWQPSLTTVATGPVKMGEQVAQLMLRRIADPDMPIEQLFIPPRLIQRDSTIPLA